MTSLYAPEHLDGSFAPEHEVVAGSLNRVAGLRPPFQLADNPRPVGQ